MRGWCLRSPIIGYICPIGGGEGEGVTYRNGLLNLDWGRALCVGPSETVVDWLSRITCQTLERMMFRDRETKDEPILVCEKYLLLALAPRLIRHRRDISFAGISPDVPDWLDNPSSAARVPWKNLSVASFARDNSNLAQHISTSLGGQCKNVSIVRLSLKSIQSISKLKFSLMRSISASEQSITNRCGVEMITIPLYCTLNQKVAAET